MGSSLKRAYSKGSCSLPESKLHINYMEWKAVFLALRVFQDFCSDKIILFGRQHQSGVIHKQEGVRRSDSMGALLWGILIWFSSKQVTPSPTLSRPTEYGSKQTIQPRPDHPKRVVSPSRGFPISMQQVAPALRDLFAMGFNKLAQFVSPVPDPLARAMDGLGLLWESLDANAFPPAAILGK